MPGGCVVSLQVVTSLAGRWPRVRTKTFIENKQNDTGVYELRLDLCISLKKSLAMIRSVI